jgi:hypothetical protein
VGGAIGGEALGGWYASHHGDHNLTYALLVAIEEGLEIAGLTLFLRGLLDYATCQVAVRPLIVSGQTAEGDSLGRSSSSDVPAPTDPPTPDYRLSPRRRRVA